MSGKDKKVEILTQNQTSQKLKSPNLDETKYINTMKLSTLFSTLFLGANAYQFAEGVKTRNVSEMLSDVEA